jgi:hypothetical protein
MREYKLSPQFFSQITKRILIVGLPIMLLALAGGLWIGGQEAQSITPFLIIVPLFLIILTFSIVRGINKQKRNWSSYRVILDESSIKRVQTGLPEVTIEYGDISKIVESTGVGLVILGSTPSRQISVPATLEDYSQFSLELSSRHSFENIPVAQTKWMQFSPSLVGLATIVAFVITFISSNPYIGAITGILLFGGLTVSLVQIQRNSQITKQVKWQSCLILLPLFAIATRVLFNILIIIASIWK